MVTSTLTIVDVSVDNNNTQYLCEPKFRIESSVAVIMIIGEKSTHTHTRKHTHKHTHKYTHKHTHTHTTHAHTHKHTHTNTHTHTSTHKHTHTNTHKHTPVCSYPRKDILKTFVLL